MKYLKETSALGVSGLDPQYNIDEIKKECEIYQDVMKWEKGEQLKWI